jgi:hypothetical protein
MSPPEALRAAARRARREAGDLRALASRLDHSHLHELTRLAGERTWVGPTASELQAAVSAGRHDLEGAADDLRRQAAVLDQEAEDCDRAAMRAELLELLPT